MNEQQVEQEIQSKHLTAPRITPEHIDSLIERVDYHIFPGTTTTVCCIVLKNRNNHTVIGHSACVSESNFDAEIGKKVAFKNAREKIWALEGYALALQLAGEIV